MRLIEYTDREMLFLSLANQVTGELGQALRSAGRASLAVPGGTTPGPLFDLLSEVSLDWSAVTVCLTDERWLPEDHARSNTGLLRDRLFKGPAAEANLSPLYLPDTTPEQAEAQLSEFLTPHLPLTTAVLGMGEDRHIASLFAGADRLAEALAPDAPAVLAIRAPEAPEPRMTLSARVLNQALSLHLIIFGDAKRQALESSVNLSPELAPVRAVLDNVAIHWAE